MDRILPLTPAILQQSAVFFFEGLDTPMQQEGDSWSFTGRAQNPFHQAVGMKTIQQKSHSRAKVFSALASVNLGLHAVALKGKSTMKVKWVECCLELMLFGWKWGRHAHDPAELMDMPKGKEFGQGWCGGREIGHSGHRFAELPSLTCLACFAGSFSTEAAQLGLQGGSNCLIWPHWPSWWQRKT